MIFSDQKWMHGTGKLIQYDWKKQKKTCQHYLDWSKILTMNHLYLFMYVKFYFGCCNQG